MCTPVLPAQCGSAHKAEARAAHSVRWAAASPSLPTAAARAATTPLRRICSSSPRAGDNSSSSALTCGSSRGLGFRV